MEVNNATFTFNRMPEVVVGGQKLAFQKINLNGKEIEGAVMKDGTIARLTRRDDGKFDVKLTRGPDLSKRPVRIEGGVLSRLSTREGDKVEKYDIPTETGKLISGKKLKLDSNFAQEMTKGLTPLGPKIVIRPMEGRERRGGMSRPKQEDPVLVPLERERPKSVPTGPKQEDPGLVSLERERSKSVPTGPKQEDPGLVRLERERSKSVPTGPKQEDPDLVRLERERSKSVPTGPKQEDPDLVSLERERPKTVTDRRQETLTDQSSESDKRLEQWIDDLPPLPELPSEKPTTLAPHRTPGKKDPDQ